MTPSRPLPFALSLAVCLGGCAGSQHQPTTPGPGEVVEMEELRITARRGADGNYDFSAHDASQLFEKGTALLNAEQCRDAVAFYDQLNKEFPASRFASASLYNAGLCLQAVGDFAASADRYGLLLERHPDSEDVKDTSFQLAEVLVQLERWAQVETTADSLLARTDLSPDERLEGMSRRAQALLGAGKLSEAQRYAQSALSYFRTRPAAERIPDEFHAAATNYVLAESYRVRAQLLAFPVGLEPQKKVLVERAELLLEAQREYFNTISYKNLDNLHWAAASGYRIGFMYDELWHSVMAAPVPATLPAEGHRVYHQELAKLIKPLIRHAIRYWELTLMFIERTGLEGRWADKTRDDLKRVRTLMMQQPAGPGGLPRAAPPSAPAGEPSKEDPKAPPAQPTT